MDLTSRKFILTIVYVVVFVSNYVFKLLIPWEALLALAGMLGLYNIANAVQGAAYAKADGFVAEAQIAADCSCAQSTGIDYDMIAELVAEAQSEEGVDYDALAEAVAEAQCEADEVV